MHYTEKNRKFFEQTSDVLAPLLLGKILCHRISDNAILKFKITETEAYCANESFCYGYGNYKPKNKSSVFFSVGKLCDYYSMLMISCCNTEYSGNVLIRCAEHIVSNKESVC